MLRLLAVVSVALAACTRAEPDVKNGHSGATPDEEPRSGTPTSDGGAGSPRPGEPAEDDAVSGPNATESARCQPGGCSGELCVDKNAEPVMSPCIYRAEYACYQSATCERGANGQCAWRATPELESCLANPPAR